MFKLKGTYIFWEMKYFESLIFQSAVFTVEIFAVGIDLISDLMCNPILDLFKCQLFNLIWNEIMNMK